MFLVRLLGGIKAQKWLLSLLSSCNIFLMASFESLNSNVAPQPFSPFRVPSVMLSQGRSCFVSVCEELLNEFKKLFLSLDQNYCLLENQYNYGLNQNIKTEIGHQLEKGTSRPYTELQFLEIDHLAIIFLFFQLLTSYVFNRSSGSYNW
jgi:hypothetical protein